MIRRAVQALVTLALASAIGASIMHTAPAFSTVGRAIGDSLTCALPAALLGIALARSRALEHVAAPVLSLAAVGTMLLWSGGTATGSTPLAIAAVSLAVAPLIVRGELGLAVIALPVCELALGRPGIGQAIAAAARAGDRAELLGAALVLLVPAVAGELIAARRLPTLQGSIRPLPLRIALGVIACALGLALIGPTIAGSASITLASPIPLERMQGPSALHWLGTDQLGRDLLARVSNATRASLLLAGAASLTGTLLAAVTTALTAILGARGLTAQAALERAVLALPLLPLVVGSVSLLDGSTALGTGALLGLLCWAVAARRLRLRAESVLAARTVWRTRSLGGSEIVVVRRHLLPSLRPAALSAGLVALATALVAESSLSLVSGDRTTLGGVLADAVGAGALPAGAWWYGAITGAWVALLASAILLVARTERQA